MSADRGEARHHKAVGNGFYDSFQWPAHGSFRRKKVYYLASETLPFPDEAFRTVLLLRRAHWIGLLYPLKIGSLEAGVFG